MYGVSVWQWGGSYKGAKLERGNRPKPGGRVWDELRMLWLRISAHRPTATQSTARSCPYRAFPRLAESAIARSSFSLRSCSPRRLVACLAFAYRTRSVALFVSRAGAYACGIADCVTSRISRPLSTAPHIYLASQRTRCCRDLPASMPAALCVLREPHKLGLALKAVPIR